MIRKDREVVEYLIENRNKTLNIRNIAQGLKLDYRNAHNIVKRLQMENIVALQIMGKSKNIMLKNILTPLLYEAEDRRRQVILKNKNIKTIADYFINLKTKLFVLILFGSYAKRKASVQSDIDLLCIVPNDDIDIQKAAAMLPEKLNVHMNILTEKEFISMKNSKEDTIVSETVKNNIILYGIEAYYGYLQ